MNSGHEDVVRILLKSGANVNIKTATYHWTPLHIASFYGIPFICNYSSK